MQGKLSIVTGSTSGIGLGIAKKLASQGSNILINGFCDDKILDRIINEIQDQYSVICKHYKGDLTIAEEAENIGKFAYDNFGRVDILVNNAGMQFVSPIETFPNDKWEKIIRLNLVSNFYTSKSVIPYMKENKFGRIINIASAHGLVASPFKTAYVAAKHGVVGLTKSAALEVAKDGITVNAICPGYVKTDLVLGQVADTAKARGISEDEVIQKIMLTPQYTGKFVEIEEVADLVLFLCKETSGSITGASLSIDGGWTSH